MHVYVDFSEMDSQGKYTGKKVKLTIADDGTSEFEAVGLGANSTIDESDLSGKVNDETTNKYFILRNTVLTFAKVTDNLVSKLDSASSDAVLYEFTITNSDGGSVDIGKFTFKFDLTDNDGGSDLKLKDIRLWINDDDVTDSEALYSGNC